MKFPLLKKLNWGLVIILFLATIIRFGGLTWCFPYNPHPDEWNMAAAITRLDWQKSLNPQFFAYGQFPLYLAYFSALIYNTVFFWTKITQINTPEAIFFLRFWSALAGIGTVYLVYLISRRLLTAHCSLLAVLLAAFTPGLIQISHFGTTESLLSFFFLLILLFSLKILENPKPKYFIFSGVTLGLALGTKISALIFGFPIFLVFLIQFISKAGKRDRKVVDECFLSTKDKTNSETSFACEAGLEDTTGVSPWSFIGTLKKKNKIRNIAVLILKNLTLLIFLTLLTLLSSPYLVLAFKDSRGTLSYETSVATGQSQVFYTRQFLETKPILFQLQKIFPYVLGWSIFIFGTLGFFLMLFFLFKSIFKRKESPLLNTYFLILASFLVYFLPQTFLFSKWTRFMAPIFAFFPIFAGISLSYLRNLRYLSNLLVLLAILPGILFSSIYFRPDIRFKASEWIFKNIPTGTRILYDTGNVVDIPILPPQSKVLKQYPGYNIEHISFDFYHLDESPELFPKLLNYLETSDYIFVPSRRIFKNSMRFPQLFPKTNRYYELLFSGRLGFVEVAKIEPFYSKIFKDEQAEETFSVFDHPTIRIYKKITILTKEEYENLFR